ncbi:MAG: FHA domain-containing protein [Comamonadaceae bacterium]|nr:MAG: FHA domain-containing protein [Comamonadaceae bacterium]
MSAAAGAVATRGATDHPRIVIRTPDGVIEERFFEVDTVRIGKAESNHIVIKGWSVGKHHADIVVRPEGLFVECTSQLVGIDVNGERVRRFGPLAAKDEIELAGHSLYVFMGSAPGAGAAAAGAPAAAAGDGQASVAGSHAGKPAEGHRAAGAAADGGRPATPGGATDRTAGRGADAAPAPGAMTTAGDPAPARGAQAVLVAAAGTGAAPAQARSGMASATMPGSPSADELAALRSHRLLRERVHEGLIQLMDVRRTDVTHMSDAELRSATRAMVSLVLRDITDLPAGIDMEALSREVVAEAVGLGPLEPLLQDESVTEIMVNAHDQIFIERGGRIEQSSATFTSPKAVLAAIERIVSPLGRKIDESSPMVDGRLKDGSRVNAVIPPLALKGPCISIRKFSKKRLYGEDLVRFGSMNADILSFLSFAVLHAQNCIISGGTGSGKTTLLNVLSNFIPDHERIVTVEDAAELRLHQPNLVGLEARPANSEGRGAVPIRDLVRNCLRMRPDRIVVGECRGGEALDMLQAMNTGHDGSLTTAHANTPRDLLSRVEVMVMMAGMELPIVAIREQIASAINLVIQQTRFKCGSRKVTSVTEITGVESGKVQLQEIFRFRQDGYDENGRVRGEFVATGAIPEFIEGLRAAGIETPPLSIFEVPGTAGVPQHA